MLRRLLVLMALTLAAVPLWVRAQARQNLIEFLTASLQADQGFSDAERAKMLEAVQARFADYSLQVLDPQRRAGAQVAMRMIIEGHFDSAAPERQAEVAFAAYQAISRGAPAEVAEGIALYGYRKKVSADRISTWANGYNDAVQAGVPPAVAADLVRNAMENDWEDAAFNTIKWGLVDGAKQRYDPRDYATFVLGNMQKPGARPGAVTADAVTAFRQARASGKKPALPAYEGVFSQSKTPKAVLYEALPKPEPETAPAPRPAGPREPKTVRVDDHPSRPATPPRISKTAPAKREPQEQRKPSDLGLTMSGLWPGLDHSVRSYLGTPYVWGGTTKRGIDCSALTQNSYGENKVGIPRVSRQQWKIGDSTPFKDLHEGDLIFFNTMGVGVSHVGMIIDAGGPRFIHASSSRGVVIDNLTKKYYMGRYLGGRRVVP